METTTQKLNEIYKTTPFTLSEIQRTFDVVKDLRTTELIAILAIKTGRSMDDICEIIKDL